jgi:hypothetical protein
MQSLKNSEITPGTDFWVRSKKSQKGISEITDNVNTYAELYDESFLSSTTIFKSIEETVYISNSTAGDLFLKHENGKVIGYAYGGLLSGQVYLKLNNGFEAYLHQKSFRAEYFWTDKENNLLLSFEGSSSSLKIIPNNPPTDTFNFTILLFTGIKSIRVKELHTF